MTATSEPGTPDDWSDTGPIPLPPGRPANDSPETAPEAPAAIEDAAKPAPLGHPDASAGAVGGGDRVMPADVTGDEIGAPPRLPVRLSEPAKVATLILTAAITSYDPGTEPWTVLHDAADEIHEAMRGEP